MVSLLGEVSDGKEVGRRTALHKNVRYEGYSPAKAQTKVQRNAAALCVFAGDIFT